MNEDPHGGYPLFDGLDLDDEDDVQTVLSQQRTAFALQRTVWSAERTLNAWLRTALASSATALAIFQFLRARQTWVTPAIGATLAVAGVFMYLYGLWRYRQASVHLREAGARPSSTAVIGAIVAPLILAGIFTLFLLLSLKV